MKNKHITAFGEGSLKTYAIGYGLSIVLTIIPFALVMSSMMARFIILLAIILLAVTQIIVHLVYFLHLRPTADQSWNWLAFIYTLSLLCMIVGGSAWIMYHLKNNMM